MIRSFAALRLSKVVTDELDRCMTNLKSLDKKNEIRWVSSKNYHLTLCFFGDIDPNIVDSLKCNLSNRLAKIPVVNVVISDVSFFPFSKNPRIVAGIVRATNSLNTLKTTVDRVARNADIPVEKRGFKPHVTLGRVKGRFRPKIKIASFPLDLNCDISELTVFRSMLSTKGAAYISLFDVPLMRADSLYVKPPITP